jgi:hypothetical protein
VCRRFESCRGHLTDLLGVAEADGVPPEDGADGGHEVGVAWLYEALGEGLVQGCEDTG